VFASGDQPTLLVELYTSEGCSSCPPAERYLNGLKSRPELWVSYVPVAFHVDYWNYLGWEDRFASQAFSDRQRQHARTGNVRTVYTPALIVDGSEWRPGLFDRLPKPETGRAAGRLEVTLDNPRLTVEFKPLSGEAPALTLHIALLGMGLVSDIRAGENKGRMSHHEFVVIGFKSIPGFDGRWQTELPEPDISGPERKALAVWVTPRDSLKPLQAVGGYID
jgi:hypothetical protein